MRAMQAKNLCWSFTHFASIHSICLCPGIRALGTIFIISTVWIKFVHPPCHCLPGFVPSTWFSSSEKHTSRLNRFKLDCKLIWIRERCKWFVLLCKTMRDITLHWYLCWCYKNMKNRVIILNPTATQLLMCFEVVDFWDL